MDGNGSFRPDDATPRPPRPGPPQRHRVARRRSSPTPRQGALLTGLTLVAAVLVGITITTPSGGAAPSGSPGVARATAGPSDGGGTGSNAPVTPPPGGPTPVTTPEPTVDPAGWSAVDLPPYEPVADLAPTRTEPGGASIDTAFVLTSRSGPAADLAKHLEVVPPVDLAVARGGTAASVRLTPVVPLDQGTTYRFALRLADGSLAGSWVYQTGSAPRVARTLPADKRTNVPVDTGIEITWDQDGVGNLAPYFSISPKVGGRFERHGRTAVFVPDALQPRTVYTVTVRRGVDLEGSRLVLDRDVTFQFETRAKDGTKVKRPRWLAAEPLVESPTGSAPLISVSADRRITRVDVRVHRLPTLEGAVRAYLALRDAPDWAQRSDTGVVPVAGLARVARFSVPVNHWPSDGRDGGWIKFPDSLPAGWYLVTIPRDGRDVQLVLQVTDVQATAITGSGRTVVWAHDLAAGGPLGGATVRGLDRGRFGRTAADGLLVAPTPARLATADLEAAPRDRIIVVRAAGEEAGAAPRPDRTLFLPVDAWASDVPFRDRFWRLLYTDRSLFRSTDTIEAWGVLQPRTGGAAPAAELRLVAGGCWDGYDDEGESCADVAIVRAAVRPDASTGVFTASVPIAGVPAGDYELALYVDDLRAAGTHLAIGVIRKPAYRLDVVTDRTVVVAGDRLVATATASFFDGTPAPGVAFVVGSGFEDDEGEDVATRTTGADGRGDAVVPVEINDGQWAWREVAVWPEGPEEASISASTSVLAFASRVVLDGEATLDGPSLAIAGSLHQVDLERLEREVRAGLDQEIRPNGAAVAGATVRIRIEERWQVKVPTGRVYDFIAKKAIDTYEYRDRERSLGTRRVTTDANGRFALETDVASDHWYTIDVLADDADGRTTSSTCGPSARRPWIAAARAGCRHSHSTATSTRTASARTRSATRSGRRSAGPTAPRCPPGATGSTSSSRRGRAISTRASRRRRDSARHSRRPTSPASRSGPRGSTARPAVSRASTGAVVPTSRPWRHRSTRRRARSRSSWRPTPPAIAPARPRPWRSARRMRRGARWRPTSSSAPSTRSCTRSAAPLRARPSTSSTGPSRAATASQRPPDRTRSPSSSRSPGRRAGRAPPAAAART